MVKRALLTGSEGFTGRYMRAELEAAGYEVIGLGAGPGPAAGYVQADLQQAQALRAVVEQVQPEVVVHLAALAFVGHGEADDFYRVNLLGTRNLLAALAAAPQRPSAVLLASSANVYGNQSEGCLAESVLPAPANDYAVSKLAMEYMARTWLPELPIFIARPFNYTGVGQAEHFLLPKIVSHFVRREPVIELGNLDVSRDFSDVRAVVAAYRGLLEKRPVGETFNIASGNAHTLKEVLRLCEELTGHQPEVRVNPAFVRSNEVRYLCGDASRLRACLGTWQTPTLRETLGWMLDGARV